MKFTVNREKLSKALQKVSSIIIYCDKFFLQIVSNNCNLHFRAPFFRFYQWKAETISLHIIL